ncbi:SRPBCC family protein [Luteipulveratus flavus]|uniref:SRPBCC domain-containing protein n=1 Tax=Luteipulveratus flavus TaxID=3031728 RepID=A0ABT6C613_9MICO|nr:SRPBCC domain-containing protein [Luteipulveratus sp. YIM 133296]MDF8264335.1 SRPBCC domain-containing protein [Luteipulveratus sp. YIM 133296]
MPLVIADVVDNRVQMTWRVDAAPERVWQALTSPPGMAEWLGEVVSGAVAPDESFVVDHGDGHRCASTVTALVPGEALTYSWEFPDEPRSEVSWTLSPADEGTMLEVTHAGLGDLARSYRDGWTVHLTYLEASAHGVPLPSAMFWPLHATVVRLSQDR